MQAKSSADPRNVTVAGRSATSRTAAVPPAVTRVDTPEVIPITDFRRDAARIIAAHVAAETPVYITQRGQVTAVVISPKRYRGLVRRAGQGTSTGERGTPAAADADRERRSANCCDHIDVVTAETLAQGGWSEVTHQTG
jgi:prevent-host-death family protein